MTFQKRTATIGKIRSNLHQLGAFKGRFFQEFVVGDTAESGHACRSGKTFEVRISVIRVVIHPNVETVSLVTGHRQVVGVRCIMEKYKI